MFWTSVLVASLMASPLRRALLVLVIVGPAVFGAAFATGSPSPNRRWLSFSWMPPSSGRIDGRRRMGSPGCEAASTPSSVANGRFRLPPPPPAAAALTYQADAGSLERR